MCRRFPRPRPHAQGRCNRTAPPCARASGSMPSAQRPFFHLRRTLRTRLQIPRALRQTLQPWIRNAPRLFRTLPSSLQKLLSCLRDGSNRTRSDGSNGRISLWCQPTWWFALRSVSSLVPFFLSLRLKFTIVKRENQDSVLRNTKATQFPAKVGRKIMPCPARKVKREGRISTKSPQLSRSW